MFVNRCKNDPKFREKVFNLQKVRTTRLRLSVTMCVCNVRKCKEKDRK